MSKHNKPQTGAAQAAAPAPEAPRQSAQTAAEAGLPQVQAEDEQTADPAFDAEGYAGFLAEQSAEDFEAAFNVMLAEAHTRGLVGTEADEASESKPEAIAPHDAVKKALSELPEVQQAYLLPDGSWRFSKAAALAAVGGKKNQLTIISNDSYSLD